MSGFYFTIIIPTYNRADMLKVALKSIEKQTFKDFEVYVIDDNSKDHTAKIFDEFKNKQNWHFIKLDTNHGYPYAKNLVFDKANSKYITFLDSDDIWMPERLEEFHKYTLQYPDAGFIFSNGYILQDGYVISEMVSHEKTVPTGMLPAYMAVSNYWLPYVTTNVAIRKDAVEKAGKYLENMVYLGDTEYFARVIKDFKTGYIERPLSLYRIHNVSITQSWEKCMEESIFTLKTTNPPEDINNMLLDFIYINQASILIKHGTTPDITRQLLSKTSKKTFKTTMLYFISYLPAFIIRLLRKPFKSFRLFKVKLLGSNKYREAYNFYISLN